MFAAPRARGRQLRRLEPGGAGPVALEAQLARVPVDQRIDLRRPAEPPHGRGAEEAQRAVHERAQDRGVERGRQVSAERLARRPCSELGVDGTRQLDVQPAHAAGALERGERLRRQPRAHARADRGR
jgi:hypothetical protein